MFPDLLVEHVGPRAIDASIKFDSQRPWPVEWTVKLLLGHVLHVFVCEHFTRLEALGDTSFHTWPQGSIGTTYPGVPVNLCMQGPACHKMRSPYQYHSPIILHRQVLGHYSH